jgi:hypothetical protein
VARIGEAGSTPVGVGCPGRAAEGRVNRERWLEGLAVNVLTALGERDGAVQDAERPAGEALRTTTDDEDLSVSEAADWCGSGVTVREVTRLR